MSETWLLPNLVFNGHDLEPNKALRVSDNVITEVVDAERAPESARTVQGIVSPGFVDLQVNGGGGILFNTSRSAEGVARIADAHRQFGTTAILPTVITDKREVLSEAVQAVITAKDDPSILGIHIEGPHISVPRRGTHSECFVRPIDDDTIAHVARLRDDDFPVMITVAPESASPEQVTKLADLGAIVSIGHSDATAEATRAAIAAGASCATHLFNAMSPMLNREPGVTGAVINSEIAAGIIVDGIHVADEMIALALRARPRTDSTFIVSDAMPTVGGPDKFSLYGMDVMLSDGRLINSEGSLAGAHFTQAEGVFRLVNAIGIDPASALRMAITTPAELVGRADLATLVGTKCSDAICLSDDFSFQGFLVQ